MSVLGELFRQERPVAHATGSSAFTRTLRAVVGKGERRVEELFKFFNEFGAEPKNEVETLICEEAHRIRRYSARPSKQWRGLALQLDELLDVARIPVFLFDEHQVVKPDEVGTIDFIRDRAHAKGLDVEVVDLDGQFRYGRSRAYEE